MENVYTTRESLRGVWSWLEDLLNLVLKVYVIFRRLNQSASTHTLSAFRQTQSSIPDTRPDRTHGRIDVLQFIKIEGGHK